MAKYLFDCETNGLLDQLDTVHCLVLRDIETDAEHDFGPDQVEDGVKMLADAELIVAHNAINFDVPALRKVYPWFNPDQAKVFDTVVASRLIWTNLKDIDFENRKKGKAPNFPMHLAGRHSLEAWGHRLGEHKGEYGKGLSNDEKWRAWNPEMHEYCRQDVIVLRELWRLIQAAQYSEAAFELEHQVAWIVNAQERHGFCFDVQAAVDLLTTLARKRDELEERLRDTFKPWYVRGNLKEPKRTINYKDPSRISPMAGCPYTEVKLTEFNPGSRHHIADRLIKLRGWKPKEYTDKGQPKIDETVLGKLPYPEAELLAEFFMVQKRLGQLADGSNSWLRLENNGRIHGRVNTNGAATGRMTHSHPNVTQVPSVRKPYGKECRGLFIAPPGRLIVGADVAGLELRMLAHYMARYDDGEYGEVILKGDVHTHNQLAAGLPTRDNAKTFIYGFMYGAGDTKIGEIVKPGATDAAKRKIGKQLREKFLKEIPALGVLTSTVKAAFNKKGYLLGLDGRRLMVRSEHSALNMLLQGGGAIVCKQWMVETHRLLEERGLADRCAQVATVHDELQFEADEEVAEEVGKTIVDAITAAGQHFNLRIPLDGEFKIGASWADTH